MSDAKKIKNKTKVKSGKVTPEEARKDLDKLTEDELDEVSGGMATMYSDWAKSKIGPER
jgi:bacteriocin-like protein